MKLFFYPSNLLLPGLRVTQGKLEPLPTVMVQMRGTTPDRVQFKTTATHSDTHLNAHLKTI